MCYRNLMQFGVNNSSRSLFSVPRTLLIIKKNTLQHHCSLISACSLLSEPSTEQGSKALLLSTLCDVRHILQRGAKVTQGLSHPLQHSPIPAPLPLHSLATTLYSISRDLLILDISHKQKHTIYGTTYNMFN